MRCFMVRLSGSTKYKAVDVLLGMTADDKCPRALKICYPVTVDKSLDEYNMWQMNLKQRRRHGELVEQLHVLKRSPYSSVPDGYVFGNDKEEDEKYQDALDTLKSLLQEMHDLEQEVRDR